MRLLPPPLRAPVLAQHTLAYVFSASPTERATYFRAVLDTQDLEDFRNAVEGLKSKLTVPQPPELTKLAVVETIPEAAATVGGLRKAKTATDLEKTLARTLATLLTALGVTAKGSLKDEADQLDAMLDGRRKQAFPLGLFSRKAFVSWPGLLAETSTTLLDFDRERTGVNVETRRLTVLFEAVLSLPEVEHAHDPQDCPVCGTASALTPTRVSHIRGQVEASASYQAAMKAATQLLSDVDGRLLALSQMAAQALPKFAPMTAANRRKEHFRLSEIRRLVLDQTLVDAWVQATRNVIRSTRRLQRMIGKARADIAAASADISVWSAASDLITALEHVAELYAACEAAQQAYAAPAQALAQPLTASVDQSVKTNGWQELIEFAREPNALRHALGEARAHAAKVKSLENALKEIDTGNGKVADQKFDGLSVSVKLWWDRLRPDEPSFFSSVGRRGSKTRRTIDLKVGLSAKDDRSDPKFRDAIAVFSQSQLHCLGLSLFLARAIEERTGFIVLDDPVLTSDEDYRANFNSTVIEELLAAGVQIVVITQDHKGWKDIGQRWAHRDVGQLQLIRHTPSVGTEVRNVQDELATMISKASAPANSHDPDLRKQGATQLRQVIERFGKEVLVRHRRNNGDPLASITEYDGHDFGTYNAGVFALLTKDRSHPGKLRSGFGYVTPGAHDDTPPSRGDLRQVLGDLKQLKRDYLD